MSENESENKKTWDVEVGQYKANAKVLIKREGLAKAQLETAIQSDKRFDSKDAASSLEMLHLYDAYPLLKFGISEAEGFELPLTEETFWNLPDQFVLDLSEVIKEKNPQYGIPLSVLQRAMFANFLGSTENGQTNTSSSEESDKTSSSPD